MQRHELTEERQVEEAAEVVVPLALHLETSAMTSSVAARTASNSAAGRGALAGVAQQHQRHRLAGHVAALAPAGQLVVGQLRQCGREGRRLGVEVHLGLPPPRRHAATPAAP